jgi:hypothetical protein
VDLEALTRRAVDHAMRSIADGGGPLIPFTMTLDASNPDPRYHEIRLVRYVGEYLEDCLAQARASIDPSLDGMAHVAMYALAWDGYATIDGRRLDAILVESGAADTAEASVVAQPYQTREAGLPLRRSRRAAAVGKPVLAATLTSRLWCADGPEDRP